jgi:hypothetical protein
MSRVEQGNTVRHWLNRRIQTANYLGTPTTTIQLRLKLKRGSLLLDFH